jgi:hypothetical protein
MALADRRHNEVRINRRWRLRFARHKALGPATAERHAQWQERMALLRAHHNKCPCGQCSMKWPSPKLPEVRAMNWAGETE